MRTPNDLLDEGSLAKRRAIFNTNDPLVQKGGIPVAAIIAADDLKRFQRFEQERAERFAVIDEGWEAFRNVDLGDVDAEVAKAVAEARAELRAEREAAALKA